MSEYFDKYEYYTRAVQSPEIDVEFFRDTYKEIRGRLPRSMREDFCGTFALSCAWVKASSTFTAIGVDNDEEPIEYGKQKFLSNLTEDEAQRLRIIRDNVLSPDLPATDIVVAVNFSHYIFKRRQQMFQYFQSVRGTLNSGGLFIIDAFGGSETLMPIEEETTHDGFSYFWDEEKYNPITNEALFHIHFQRKGEPKREKVFTYDWRMWTLPELRDIMIEAGFSQTHVYWEGTTADGEGDGNYSRTELGDACQSWVAYVVGEK